MPLIRHVTFDALILVIYSIKLPNANIIPICEQHAGWLVFMLFAHLVCKKSMEINDAVDCLQCYTSFNGTIKAYKLCTYAVKVKSYFLLPSEAYINV